jgi:hypothetical protein
MPKSSKSISDSEIFRGLRPDWPRFQIRMQVYFASVGADKIISGHLVNPGPRPVLPAAFGNNQDRENHKLLVSEWESADRRFREANASGLELLIERLDESLMTLISNTSGNLLDCWNLLMATYGPLGDNADDKEHLHRKLLNLKIKKGDRVAPFLSNFELLADRCGFMRLDPAGDYEFEHALRGYLKSAFGTKEWQQAISLSDQLQHSYDDLKKFLIEEDNRQMNSASVKRTAEGDRVLALHRDGTRDENSEDEHHDKRLRTTKGAYPAQRGRGGGRFGSQRGGRGRNPEGRGSYSARGGNGRGNNRAHRGDNRPVSQSYQGRGWNKTCQNCGNPGHEAPHCLSPLCGFCHQLSSGHNWSNCPARLTHLQVAKTPNPALRAVQLPGSRIQDPTSRPLAHPNQLL